MIVGLMISRIFSMMVDGPPNAAALVLFSFEIVVTAASIFALRSPTTATQLQTA